MLAVKAGVDIESHAAAMFNAGSKLKKKTPDDLFHIDCKTFKAEGVTLSVAQVTSVSASELKRVKEKMIPYMENLLPTSGANMLFMLLTNIIDETSELLFVGASAKAVVQAAFNAEPDAHSVVLDGVVSRKKQVLGPLIKAIEEA